MKNVTLSLDDRTYQKARIEAARRNQSLSALVREYLQSLAPDAGDPQDQARRLFSALDRARGFRAADRLGREAAHERKRVP
jgi:plasmid stability protein